MEADRENCFTMSKNPQTKYQCRKEGCGLSCTLPQNRLRHGRLGGHMPQKRRDWNETLYNAEFKCLNAPFQTVMYHQNENWIWKDIWQCVKQSRNKNTPNWHVHIAK